MRSEWLFILKVGPESRQAAIEVLSEVMTFAAFDVPLRLLFLDRGAKLLSAAHDPELSGMLSALSLYGVDELFVEIESCEAEEAIHCAMLYRCTKFHGWGFPISSSRTGE